MGAVVGVGCNCGKGATVPCPTLGDMQQALAELKRLGWVYVDGKPRCPDCARAAATPAPASVDRQLSLELG